MTMVSCAPECKGTGSSDQVSHPMIMPLLSGFLRLSVGWQLAASFTQHHKMSHTRGSCCMAYMVPWTTQPLVCCRDCSNEVYAGAACARNRD